MDVLTAVFVAPFLDMADSPAFFFEVVIGGLMTGVMYSLVALGFVLIFFAFSVFNFAQGVFALFAAMTLVGLMTGTVPFALDKALPGMPAFVAIVLTGVVMVGLAFVVERVVLRPMVNQDHIIMFMSTIGIAFVLEGFGDLMWGSDVKVLDVGIPTGSFFFLDMMIQVFDLWAAAIAGVLVIGLAVFFQKTRTGRALRAVADDHQAALSVGIPLKTIWVIVWSVAGIVALVAGIMWGSKSGVQFSLSLIALRALPVLILGGFTSVPGAIVGGLCIGLAQAIVQASTLIEVRSASEIAPYILLLIVLVIRPEGLFGLKRIERV